MAKEKLRVRVVTPEKPVFEGDADMVVVPAHDGELGILPRHARLLASLGFGSLRIHEETQVHRWFLEGGFVQVREGLVTILCERATTFESLDVDQADKVASEAREAGSPDAHNLQQRAVVMRRVAATALAVTTGRT